MYTKSLHLAPKSKYLDGESVYEHNFLALCAKGHKRNFIWHDDSIEKKVCVRDICVFCQQERSFTVKKYWEEPKQIQEV